MPSTNMVKVVDGPSSNGRRLGWWAREAPRNEYDISKLSNNSDVIDKDIDRFDADEGDYHAPTTVDQ